MPTLSTQEYESLIREIFPQVEIKSVKPETSGWASYVLEVNNEWIFRFPMRPDVEVELRKEMRLLPDLAQYLPVAVPKYEFVWEGNEEHPLPFVGYRKLNGIHPHEVIEIPDRMTKLATSMGELLTAIQAYPQERAIALGAPDFSADQWWQVHTRFSSESAQVIREYVSDEVWGKINSLWTRLKEAAVGAAFRPTFVHNDGFSSHFFCSPSSGKVTGVIDWGDAAIGDPAKDFGGLLYDCGADFTSNVWQEYRGYQGQNFSERVRLYGYRIHFAEIEYAAETKAPRLGKLIEYLVSDTLALEWQLSSKIRTQ